MSVWTSAELDKIGSAEELEIAPLRQDGTLRKPVIIWVVCVGDELYVRSYRGRDSAWFRGVQVQHAGHISASGVSILGDKAGISTSPLGLYGYENRSLTRRSLTSAAAVIMIAPILLLFLALQRRFIDGLTQGGLKA